MRIKVTMVIDCLSINYDGLLQFCILDHNMTNHKGTRGSAILQTQNRFPPYFYLKIKEGKL